MLVPTQQSRRVASQWRLTMAALGRTVAASTTSGARDDWHRPGARHRRPETPMLQHRMSDVPRVRAAAKAST
jgi:hypothetical protein